MLNNHLTDAELWKAILKDDYRAFNILFKRYWRKMFMNAYAHLNDIGVCEEIIQDIFIYIWSKRAHLQIESFPKYLATATRYKVYNHLRSAKLATISYTEGFEDLSDNSCNNQGDENIRNEELIRQLYTYLDRLPSRCKEIFVMSRLQHLSNEEIAAKLHISKRTVENQVTNALRHIRLSLKDSALIFLLISIISREHF